MLGGGDGGGGEKQKVNSHINSRNKQMAYNANLRRIENKQSARKPNNNTHTQKEEQMEKKIYIQLQLINNGIQRKLTPKMCCCFLLKGRN